MKTKEFKDFVERLSNLTAKQRVVLQQALEAPCQSELPAVREIEARMGDDPFCPQCGSHTIGKWGSAKGLRRFRCRACKRTFNALTGTPLARLRKKEHWDQFAACLQDSKTIRASAEECGVHRNTTFRWRHRFLAWINENKPPSLHGVVEADETFFLESKKGSRNLGRKPRKRGGKASKRGRSKEQICVLVARDRSGQTTDHILPAFNAEVVEGLLGPAIDQDAMLCTDGSNVYAAFAAKRGLLHEAVNLSAGERVRAKTIHLQNVNGYHSRLKGWIARFHGVSTRWLSSYLGWRRMLDGREQALSPSVVLKSALRIIDFNTLR
jgi:transposase-like protein